MGYCYSVYRTKKFWMVARVVISPTVNRKPHESGGSNPSPSTILQMLGVLLILANGEGRKRDRGWYLASAFN